MRPAFDNTRQAAAFVATLVLLLAAPWLYAHSAWFQAKPSYSAQAIKYQKFPWVQKFISGETNDIDIAFVGASHMLMGIDTPEVQEQLSKRLGRPAVVRTICWLGSGFDAMYFMTRDLLEHRHVNTLVIYDDTSETGYNWCMPSWYQYGGDPEVMSGVSAKDQAVYYMAAVIGMPRHVTDIFTANLPYDARTPPANPMKPWNTVNPERRLGCVAPHLGYEAALNGGTTNFVPFMPKQPLPLEAVAWYSAKTAALFDFSSRPMPPVQLHFAELFGEMAKQHGCKLICLKLPVIAERNDPKITLAFRLPEVLQTNAAFLGIPPAKLFAGLTEDQVQLLYFDIGHFNANGQEWFTKTITPALLERYESAASH